MFRIEVTEGLHHLLADAPMWDSLARGVPFRQSAWLGPWWTQFGKDKQARILVARDDQDQIRGILPLYVSSHPTQGRTLSMIGDGAACSDYVSLLATEEDACEVALAMGEQLAETAADREYGWDLIDLDGVVEGDAPMAALSQCLQQKGAMLHAQSRMSTWFRPHAGSWEEHLAKHGKTQRRKMRKWSKRLETDTELEKVVAHTPVEVAEVLAALIEMHQRRWTAAGSPGSYADTKFRDFIMESAQAFCHQQRLYLVALKHHGRFIGAELNFVGGNRIQYSYSAGYDTEAAELEPGRLLNVDVIQQIYRENLVGIDYMRGDEEYKKRLATESRRVFRMRVVAPTLLPRLRHVAWRTQFELGQWMRRRSGRPLIDVVDQLTTSG